VAAHKATRPPTDLVNGPRADQAAGQAEKVREANPAPNELQADRLVAALHANLKRATEPALITRLREAADRIQAARRRCP
jgi:DNA-binding MurR/RpiR family transcriptional regulator